METPKVDFVVDPRLVATFAIQNPKQGYVDDSTVVAFRNAAWKLDQSAYNWLCWDTAHAGIDSSEEVEKERAIIRRFVDRIMETPEFALLLETTREAHFRTVTEWTDNLERASEHVADIIGFPATGAWCVYITPPGVRSGMYRRKNIFWRYRDYIPNCNTIYLWHEIMHMVLGPTDLEHAVIELIADCELRTRLNGGRYPMRHGHVGLRKLRKRLLLTWREYLRSPHPKNIYEFIARNKAASS